MAVGNLITSIGLADQSTNGSHRFTSLAATLALEDGCNRTANHVDVLETCTLRITEQSQV